MSLNLIRAVARAENNDDVHLGRLLLLLFEASNRNSRNKAIEGITKLAKLDFLLRYPNCLERALVAVNKNTELANVQSYERTTIEAKMIRFKYGPWDARYRRWLSLLASYDLITIEARGRTVYIEITSKGQEVAGQFSASPAYSDIHARSHLVIRMFGSMSATAIKDFVYRVFPELETMKWGEDILL
ncbi:MAG: hypothetical protein JW725_02195 [Candidatus Babeliaceae bacterium]|nr:hypothetical protein [Candidatus Babeliaceae bacterium]